MTRRVHADDVGGPIGGPFERTGNIMNKKLIAVCIVAGALMLPVMTYAADSDTAKTFVTDSAITTQIKAELAEKKLVSLVDISVETDSNGAVILSGTVPTKNEMNKAIAIARGVKGVTSVENHILIAAAK
jgi:hyperosmotically inducible periplasmic protein